MKHGSYSPKYRGTFSWTIAVYTRFLETLYVNAVTYILVHARIAMTAASHMHHMQHAET